MNKLWLRLTLAFGLVTFTAIVFAALLANYQVSSQFRRFVVHNQMADTVLPALTDYYAQNGTWTGVESTLSHLRGPGGMGRGRGMQAGAPQLTLADAAGHVVHDGSGAHSSGQLSHQVIAEATPIEWQNQTIGYLVMNMSHRTELTGAAQTFLDQINRSLLQAGLIAGSLGVLAGVAIARGLSAPLGQLAAAARRIARGELHQQVPVAGTDEVADLAQAFNEMGTNLQQAETLRRNLVADIAHELRTPLSVIQGNLQAILDDVYPLEKAEIAAIYDETLILNRLINDLRELARAEAGQLSLDLQATELPPLIAGAVDLFAELAREQEINLKVSLTPDLPPVLADSDRVRQGLHNLLANALRHTPAGGKIAISAAQNAEATGFIRLSVTDTGDGIPPADLPHVFDRFWRADRSRSREYGGSGLGLAIVKQLVEAQGGQIGAESEGLPGRGSCFWLGRLVGRNTCDNSARVW